MNDGESGEVEMKGKRSEICAEERDGESSLYILFGKRFAWMHGMLALLIGQKCFLGRGLVSV